MLTPSTFSINPDVAPVNIFCYKESCGSQTAVSSRQPEAKPAGCGGGSDRERLGRRPLPCAKLRGGPAYRTTRLIAIFATRTICSRRWRREGFDRLTESMKKAMAKGRTAAERLNLAGRGYVQFALQSPQHLLVMFEGPSPAEPRPEYAEPAAARVSNLLDAIAAAQAEGVLPQGRSAAAGRGCVVRRAWTGEAGHRRPTSVQPQTNFGICKLPDAGSGERHGKYS